MKQDKQLFCLTISSKEKDAVQTIIYYVVYLIMIDVSFS